MDKTHVSLLLFIVSLAATFPIRTPEQEALMEEFQEAELEERFRLLFPAIGTVILVILLCCGCFVLYFFQSTLCVVSSLAILGILSLVAISCFFER